MLKKICLIFLSLVASMPLFGVDVTDLQNQRNHIASQMNSIKRAWNTARVRIKLAQKLSFSAVAYQTAQPIIEKIIASADFVTKMDEIVAGQIDAIVNQNASFASVKTQMQLADFFPNLAADKFMQQLFSAMADKSCTSLLGQKLAQKVQELDIAIRMMQQPMVISSTTSPWL
jgi:hypothetical protein